ncbi:MAG: TonB family protein, partial [Myxococcota bacterium]|nr:TonB family protein [Myxococcota bacterium]
MPIVLATTAACLVISVGPAGAEIVPPRLLQSVAATLPENTVAQDIDVILVITIEANGSVSDISVKDGAGRPWDDAAVNAVKAFRFSPATENGIRIPVRVPFTFRYRAPSRRGLFVSSRRGRRKRERTPGYRLGGLVLEKGTRTPLAAINVEAIDVKSGNIFSATTGADGQFVIDGLPPKPVTLRIVSGEHEVIEEQVVGKPSTSEASNLATKTLYLSPVGTRQYISVVRDTAPPKAATQITLQEEELRKTPGTFGDPTRVVASLPGVARSPFGLGYFAVRGASFENTGFFIDGHPALFLYHLLGGPGILHPELVGSLDFYPGGYPVSFGRFATGAIVVNTQNPPSDRWHGQLEVDVLKSSALFSVPFDEGRGMVVMSLRRSYFELLLPLVQPNLELSYTDYQFRLTYDVTRRIRTKLVVFGSEDRVNNSLTTTNGGASNNEFALGFHRINASVDVDLHQDITLKNSIAWEYDHTDNERTSEDEETIRGDVGGYLLSIRNIMDWRAANTIGIEVGFDTLIQRIDVDLQIPTGQPLGDPNPPTFDPVITSTFI